MAVDQLCYSHFPCITTSIFIKISLSVIGGLCVGMRDAYMHSCGGSRLEMHVWERRNAPYQQATFDNNILVCAVGLLYNMCC